MLNCNVLTFTFYRTAEHFSLIIFLPFYPILRMRYIFLVSILFLAGCDFGSFDKDKRQIMAKNAIYSKLPLHSTDFDITAFREDTLKASIDSTFKNAIRYILNYQYVDSTGILHVKNAAVIFTPDGHSILNVYSQP